MSKSELPPTAKQFLTTQGREIRDKLSSVSFLEADSQCMIEFAKLWAIYYNEEAQEKAKWKTVPSRMTNMDGIEIDTKSIKDSMDLNLLK